MLFGLGVSILLCHAKIDDMNDIGGFRARAANEEVIWLDIAVNEILLVDGLDAGKLLGLSQWLGVLLLLGYLFIIGKENAPSAWPPLRPS